MPKYDKKCPKIPLITAEWTNVAAVIDIISLISPRRNISQRRKHRWHHYGQSASPSIDNEITIPFPLILLVKLPGSQIQSQAIVLISRMSENEHVSEILKRSYLPLSWNAPQEKLFWSKCVLFNEIPLCYTIDLKWCQEPILAKCQLSFPFHWKLLMSFYFKSCWKSKWHFHLNVCLIGCNIVGGLVYFL